METHNKHEKLLSVVIPTALAILWGLFLVHFEVGFFAH